MGHPGGPPTRTWSRWRRTEITFGPVGRLVATVVLLAPLWWFLHTTPIGFGLYLLTFLPVALRDVWRRVPIPAHEIDPLGVGRIVTPPPVTPDPQPGDIQSRRPPARW